MTTEKLNNIAKILEFGFEVVSLKKVAEIDNGKTLILRREYSFNYNKYNYMFYQLWDNGGEIGIEIINGRELTNDKNIHDCLFFAPSNGFTITEYNELRIAEMLKQWLINEEINYNNKVTDRASIELFQYINEIV
ncbi:MAG TPA: hypothetical protein VIK86_07885 [Candidatus Paceibacterota bacterium]